MFNKLVIYRPTAAVVAAHAAREGGLELPREIHVHADGGVVACYAHHSDAHFPTIYGVLEKHGLSRADLEQIP